MPRKGRGKQIINHSISVAKKPSRPSSLPLNQTASHVEAAPQQASLLSINTPSNGIFNLEGLMMDGATGLTPTGLTPLLSTPGFLASLPTPTFPTPSGCGANVKNEVVSPEGGHKLVSL